MGESNAVRPWIMRKIRLWVRRLIRPVILQEPNIAAKYFAYQETRDDFLIERRARLATDPFPIPPRELWVAVGPGGYGDSDDQFLEIGRDQVARILRLLQSHRVDLGPGMRILDFGCASGRLIRWFADRAESCEIWGVDVSAEHIVWCQQNLSPPFHFCTTTTAPHLPFEDRHFDFIYAGSVFTHIDELADAWFLELRRTLVPGGHLFVTVNDKHSMGIVRRNPDFNLAKRIADVEKRIPLGKVNFAMASIARSFTLYDMDYLKAKLGGLFEVRAVEHEVYGFQTGLLLKKQGTSRLA